MTDEYANVTLAHKIHSDRRFDLMAQLAGWSRWESVGRMAELWSRCTALHTDRPPASVIRHHLGVRGEQLLIEADLGERCPDGTIRVLGGGMTGGDTDRFGWYEPVRKQQSRAGTERARTAVRGAGGKFQRAGGSGPANIQRAGETVSSTANTGAGQKPPAEEPAEASALVKNEPAEPADLQREPAVVQPPDSGDQRSEIPLPRAIHGGTIRATGNPETGGEARLIWQELERARAEAGRELGVDVIPLPVGDRGERDLADRFALARTGGPAEVEKLMRQCRHAIAMAKAETVSGEKSSEWFTGTVFSGNNFARLVAKTTQKREGPHQPRDRGRQPPEQTRRTTLL